MDVRLEKREDLLLAHRFHVRIVFDPGVVISHEGNTGITDAELSCEMGLGVLGHVDGVPALRSVPPGLSLCGEARSLDHHHGSAVVHRDAACLACAQRGATQFVAVGLGQRNMVNIGLVVERVGTTPRAVHELVEHNEVTRFNLAAQ